MRSKAPHLVGLPIIDLLHRTLEHCLIAVTEEDLVIADFIALADEQSFSIIYVGNFVVYVASISFLDISIGGCSFLLVVLSFRPE